MKDASGHDVTETYGNDEDCRVIAVETILNKALVNEEIQEKFGDFKENCFPKPSGGCKCNEKNAKGEDEVVVYSKTESCRVPKDVVAQKQKVNEEIKARYGNFKENCFPKPSGGCKCNEKNAAGEEIVATYNTDAECKVQVRSKRATARATSAPSQNVRDPVREKAQQNYRAVIDELNEKFKGLREGCFPRPKGCLCVVGKDRDGRDITERRMKDADCKCKEGERGNGCPAGGA